MKLHGFRAGLDALRHEVRYGPPDAWRRWRGAASERARRKKLLRWFQDLRSAPPAVLAGANIGKGNGVHHHLEGIRDYSSLRVSLAPPDELLAHVSYHDLHTTFRDDVMAFEPNGIAVLHSHVYPYFIQWCRRHRESGVRWVHTYHLPYFPVSATRALEPWQEEINLALINDARHAHARISVSRWQQRYLSDEHEIETIYVPNAVDVRACDRADAARFHASHGLEPFILYVGRNDPVKNPGDFIRLASRMPKHRFLVAGGDLSATSMRDTWTLEPTSNVIFLGPLSRAAVQDAIAACSALVVTSVYEGLPTLVLEAMTHGKPVVVPDEPGCREAVSDGEFGHVYRPSDVADLEQKTVDAVASGGQPGSRDHILATYDWRVVAPRLDEIYRAGS